MVYGIVSAGGRAGPSRPPPGALTADVAAVLPLGEMHRRPQGFTGGVRR